MSMTLTTNNLPQFKARFDQLTHSGVDVGYLSPSPTMKEDVLINELGDPFNSIPPSHFFTSGVEAGLPKAEQIMKNGVLSSDPVDKILDKVGKVIDKSIREVGEDRNVPAHILKAVEWEVLPL